MLALRSYYHDLMARRPKEMLLQKNDTFIIHRWVKVFFINLTGMPPRVITFAHSLQEKLEWFHPNNCNNCIPNVQKCHSSGIPLRTFSDTKRPLPPFSNLNYVVTFKSRPAINNAGEFRKLKGKGKKKCLIYTS